MTAGRSVKPPSLIDKAISLVKGFDPKKQTGDSYADEATQTGDSRADVVFLKQVLTKAAVFTTYLDIVCKCHETAVTPWYISIHTRQHTERRTELRHTPRNYTVVYGLEVSHGRAEKEAVAS